MKPFVIRAACIEDAKAIVDCHKEAVEKRAANFYSINIINEWSWRANLIEKIIDDIQNQNFIFIVASVDDYILGYGVANPDAVELKSLCSRPNEIGRIGATILSELLKCCKKQGCTYLELSSSLNAEKFYIDNGFQVLKKDQHILPSGLSMDAIKMRIEL